MHEQDKIENKSNTSTKHTRNKWQGRFAIWMQYYSERLPRKYKILLLLLFVCVTFSYSLRLAALSLSGQRRLSFDTGTIEKPHNISKSGDENTRRLVIIRKEDFKKIQRFRNYMDSLAQDPTGKKVYDEIIVRRPRLMDSITIIENLLTHKQKTKH